MNIRTSSCAASSLDTAAFRTVLACDSRGLVYRVRREIMTLRQLREDPFPPVRAFGPRGRVRKSRDIRTVADKGAIGKMRT